MAKFYQMTHTEWIITCLSLHTLLTVVSSGQEGAKGLSTLLSPSSRGQIKGLSPAFQISVFFFFPQCTPVQKFSVGSFICIYLKYYIYLHIYMHTHMLIETVYTYCIYILTSVVSTLFAYVRYATGVVRSIAIQLQGSDLPLLQVNCWGNLPLPFPECYVTRL